MLNAIKEAERCVSHVEHSCTVFYHTSTPQAQMRTLMRIRMIRISLTAQRARGVLSGDLITRAFEDMTRLPEQRGAVKLPFVTNCYPMSNRNAARINARAGKPWTPTKLRAKRPIRNAARDPSFVRWSRMYCDKTSTRFLPRYSIASVNAASNFCWRLPV